MIVQIIPTNDNVSWKVTKTETMEQRKIIKYQTIFDLFGGKIKKGEFLIKDDNIAYTDEQSTSYYIPKEFVEKFCEPVYEEEKLEIEVWQNHPCGDFIHFKKGGKLTKEIIDKIKEVL